MFWKRSIEVINNNIKQLLLFKLRKLIALERRGREREMRSSHKHTKDQVQEAWNYPSGD